MRTEAQKRAEKKYSEKTMTFALKYFATDIKEGQRLKEYTEKHGISINAYVKGLIKRDLDSKTSENQE